jgi:hypothetical protein
MREGFQAASVVSPTTDARAQDRLDSRPLTACSSVNESESSNKGSKKHMVRFETPMIEEDMQHLKLRMNNIFFTYNTTRIQVTKDEFVSLQLLEYHVLVDNVDARLLMDTGANASFIDYQFIKRIGKQRDMKGHGRNSQIKLAGKGSASICYGSILLPVKIDGVKFELYFYVMDLQEVDVCFGLAWHMQFKPVFNYTTRDCSFVYKDRLIIISGKRREFRNNVVTIEHPKVDFALIGTNEFFDIHNTHPMIYRISLRETNIELLNSASRIQQQKKQDILEAMNQNEDIPQGIMESEGIEAIPNFRDIPPALMTVIKQHSELFKPLPYGPSERDVYHYIPLQPDSKIPHKKQYRLSFTESVELRKQLDQLLEKGFIRPSSSPFGAPILFAAKKNGRLRMCVDYRELNNITLKDKYAIPLVQDCFDSLVGSTIFSTLDLASGYYQVPIWPADIPKTAMNTKFGSFEWLVMPFGLTSAPSTFQRLVNHTLHSLLGICVVVYLDDVLIFSKSAEDHVNDVAKVLKLLLDAKLLAQPTKCLFGVKQLEFLGHVVSERGLEMDPKKVDAIKNWPHPQNIGELRSFIGLCNYYRNFIGGFSRLATPLTKLFGKTPWNWSSECSDAFDALKDKLLSAPCLLLPDPARKFFIFFDSSQTLSLGGVLCQLGGDGDLHPVAFESRRLTDAEKKYPVHELETLAFVHCLKKWRVYLHAQRFFVYTDNRSIETILTNRNPSLRVIRWIDWIQGYQFDIQHIPRAKNIVADILSKLGHVALPTAEEFDIDDPIVAIGLRNESLTLLSQLSFDIELFDKIRLAYTQDALWSPVIEQLKTQEVFEFNSNSRFAIGLDCLYEDGLLWEDGGLNRLVVPYTVDIFNSIMRVVHDGPLAGHRGVDRTIAEFEKYFLMEKFRRYIRNYIAACDSCQRVKVTNHGNPGLLQPLAIPNGRWTHVSMDFIVSLPKTVNGFDSIFVIVDRFSKRAHFVPHCMSDTAEDVAMLFLREVVRLHGMPISIVSDRDSRFMSSFWSALLKLLNVSRDASSSMHPQTDGQTERINRILEETLRHYVNFRRDDWDSLLPCAEFAYNSSKHSSISMSPFECDIGFLPSTFWSWTDRKSVRNESALLLVDKLKQVGEFVKSSLKESNARMKYYSDKKRVNVEFELYDLVLVDRTRFSIDAFKEFKQTKFLPKYVGPFKIIEKIGRLAYRLEIPNRSRAHNVFHVVNLKKYIESESTRKKITFPDPEIVKGYEEFEVEKILDCKTTRRKKFYLVQWKGYPLHDATWEPLENLKNASDLLRDYEDTLRNRCLSFHRSVLDSVGENVIVTDDNTRIIDCERLVNIGLTDQFSHVDYK